MRKTAEATLAGQPDKICDQIADGLVDEYLRRDKDAAVDLTVFGSHGMMMIGGEVTSKADFDVAMLAKKIYADIGYEDDIEVFVNLESQSEEMKKGPRGVCDTVIVNGYATRETREMLPRPIVYAQTIARRIDELRTTDASFHWLRPDGKVQVVMEKGEVKALTILASHGNDIDEREVKGALLERVVTPIIGEACEQVFINPLGSFTTFGFSADSGSSGRRISADTYGALIPHGDKSISGKDPYRVERCGLYMSRMAAKYLVEQGIASNAFVNVVYTLGKIEPVLIEASGLQEKSRGAKVDLSKLIKEKFDFRPEAIVERLDLAKPIYKQAAVYGQFGRLGFPWEETIRESEKEVV